MPSAAQALFGGRHPSGLARTIDRLAALLHGLRLVPRRIDFDRLLAQARAKAGEARISDPHFIEGLRVLAASADAEADLTPFGRLALAGILRHTITRRLELEAFLAAHPEVAASELMPVLLVTGLPRTGTTLLYNLLAQDPGSRPLWTWECLSPLPPPEPDTPADDPRRVRARRIVAWVQRLHPLIRTIHPTDADGPEEGRSLFSNSGMLDLAQFALHVPSYTAWLQSRMADHRTEAYRFYLLQLKLMQYRHRRTRWALKAPVHFGNLASFAALCPQLDIVVTHRSLDSVLPSLCTLVAFTRLCYSNRLDAAEIGRLVQDSALKALQRYMAARQDLGRRAIDVRYADLLHEPIQVVTSIYKRFELAWPDGFEARMRAWLERNPQNKHGPNRYTLEAYALRREDIEARFRDYAGAYLDGGDRP